MSRALLLPSQLVPARTAFRAGRRWLRWVFTSSTPLFHGHVALVVLPCP